MISVRVQDQGIGLPRRIRRPAFEGAVCVVLTVDGWIPDGGPQAAAPHGIREGQLLVADMVDGWTIPAGRIWAVLALATRSRKQPHQDTHDYALVRHGHPPAPVGPPISEK